MRWDKLRGLCMLTLCPLQWAVQLDARPRLTLNPTGSFKLSVFADLHYGENEDDFGIEQDIKSTRLMTRILRVEKPDFVVLDGDLITGENTFAFNSTKYLDKIVKPIVDGGYKWASTYGNHDSKYNLSREALFAEEQKYANSYTQHGPADSTDGVTNYMLPVYATAASPTPAVLLWFFDSRGGSQGDPQNQDNIPNWVSNRTARWFRTANAQAQAQWGVLPSLAFVHIPFKAYLDLQQSKKPPLVSGSRYPGMNNDRPLAQQGSGPESVPFMKALLDTPGLHSVYTGHDHGDSWCGRWPDKTLPGYGVGRPFLCFCKHSGYGGYGPWNRGVRQVVFSFDTSGAFNVETYVKMEQGTVITHVALNETYGQDIYPTRDGG